jgi:hypothetical protein
MSMAEVGRFAFRQGPGRMRLAAPLEVDDTALTTAWLPPAAARGDGGSPLPLGTHRALAATPYPAGRVAPVPDAERLGHVLVTAFGLQRREPSNRFNDHRVVASVRSKFPVHVFTRAAARLSYLDLYRHALVDVPGAAGDGTGGVEVLLAARYTDLPTPYGRLRGALADLETGINLRSLYIAAQLYGVRARLALDGTDAAHLAARIRATGPGAWAVPVRVALDGVEPPPPQPLPAAHQPGNQPGEQDAERDTLVEVDARHESLAETMAVARHRYSLTTPVGAAVPGIPDVTGPDGTSWATVLWRRSAGRVPDGLHGFSAYPAPVDTACLDACLAWAHGPAPAGILDEVARRMRLDVALARVGDLPTGVYRTAGCAVVSDGTDPAVMHRLQDGFGYPPSPDTDVGVRHAAMVWVWSVDVPALLSDLGPAAWSLAQLWCGWAAHGIGLACAAHGLFARPARAYDEYHVQRVLRLPRPVLPAFMVVSGHARFAEPMLDLRT